MDDKNLYEILLEYLSNEEYKAFLIEVSKIPVTKQNYKDYMNIIKNVMNENRNNQEIIPKSSGDILLEQFKEKTDDYDYFKIESLLKKAIKSHMIETLKLNKYDDADKDIITELENFESGFNY